ncbi:hypothetical protein CBM2615_B70191 [Cupriavidus taiwanensis]|uniref:Uncharacterized protein n=1 Tax=Cupriavidus taiwanensis TaxID=164546 RepID=A0A375ECR7_9BURK|nr:hypothetical protein CBM2614_B70095 [Cupriavidus taiwanensis]SOZ70314.1 hypothetical protein CBM2615_B70191 [Cupriavidus taiwanensis]SOZ73217.1 hypothetical protein CBM2613_B50323 [Cupriavidus taiwanensis]SPA10085.1 hypothetical protein CBM2625_B60240 [Cupriavidus taiwanensis]
MVLDAAAGAENFSLVRNDLLCRVQRRIGLIPTGLASRGARWYPNRKECPLLADPGRQRHLLRAAWWSGGYRSFSVTERIRLQRRQCWTQETDACRAAPLPTISMP